MMRCKSHNATDLSALRSGHTLARSLEDDVHVLVKAHQCPGHLPARVQLRADTLSHVLLKVWDVGLGHGFRITFADGGT